MKFTAIVMDNQGIPERQEMELEGCLGLRFETRDGYIEVSLRDGLVRLSAEHNIVIHPVASNAIEVEAKRR